MTRVSSNKRFMAVDQYGNTYHGLKFPRQELTKLMGVHYSSKLLKKMYAEKDDGTVVHIGYEIKGVQFRLYEVKPFEAIEDIEVATIRKAV